MPRFVSAPTFSESANAHHTVALQRTRCCSKQFCCIKRWSSSAFILSVSSLGTSLLFVEAESSHRQFCRKCWTFFHFDSLVQMPELDNGF